MSPSQRSNSVGTIHQFISLMQPDLSCKWPKLQTLYFLLRFFDSRSSNRSNTSSKRTIVNQRPAESANSSQMYPTQTNGQKSSHVCSSPQCYRAVTDWVLQRLEGNIQDVNQGVFKSTTAPFKKIINQISLFSSLQVIFLTQHWTIVN